MPHPARTRLLPVLAALLLATALFPLTPVPTAGAQESISLPFGGGRAVRIVQGYSGGTHQGRSQYGLDLVLDGATTSGAEVLAPADGTVSWTTANGCLAIALRGSVHSVVLCHVVLSRAFGRGESVARGQLLGTVGPPGTVGNNGLPHVHLELHRGALARSPVPFSPPAGLPLEGVSLPATGVSGEHGRRAPIVSTNARPAGASAPPPTPAPPPKEEPAARPAPSARSVARPAPTPEPAPTRAAEPAPPPKPAPSSAPAQAAAAAPAAPRAAVVRGTGSCLSVRAQPSLSASIAGCHPDGATLALAPGWQDADGHRWRQAGAGGWVTDAYLARTRALVATPGDCLNVRQRPSADAPIVGCLRDGTALHLVEGPTADGKLSWYRIERSAGAGWDGWVVGALLD